MLFKDITEVSAHVRVSKSLNFETFKLYEPLAQEKYMRRYCGDQLLDLINSWYDEDEPDQDETEYLALLPYLQSAVAKFALAIGGPDLDLVLNESGFGVVNNANLAPASKDRVANFIKNQEEMGYIAIEKLLRYLEANKDDFASWTNSDAYTTKWEYFIPNALVFSKIVNINESRKAYFDLMPHMSTAEEQHIIPLLGVDFAEKLKELQRDDELTNEYLTAMKHVQKATAYFTKFVETNDGAYYQKGMIWASSLKNYIQLKADDLTEYKEGEAYEADGITAPYNNEEGSGVFFAGGFPIF